MNNTLIATVTALLLILAGCSTAEGDGKASQLTSDDGTTSELSGETNGTASLPEADQNALAQAEERITELLEDADTQAGETADPQDQLETATSDASEATAAPEQFSEQIEVDAPADTGTRTNPIPLGATASVDDYQLTVQTAAADFTAQVAAENQFNDPPANGRQFVAMQATLTYTGNDEGNPWLDLNYAVVGDSQTEQSQGCGVAPQDLTDSAIVLFSGGVAEGNICLDVAATDVASIVMSVQTGCCSERTWFAVR